MKDILFFYHFKMSYKVTKFSAANIAGDCKLVDNKLKSSSGSDIIFPSSGGTLATAADSVSKVISANVNLGSAGTLTLRFVEFGSGENKVQMMIAEVSLTAEWGSGAKSATNTAFQGLGYWEASFPMGWGLTYAGRFTLEVYDNGKINTAVYLAPETSAAGAKGYVALMKTPGKSDINITLASA